MSSLFFILILYQNSSFYNSFFLYFIQLSSVVQSCPTLCKPMNCSMPGLPVHHKVLEFTELMSIESVMPSNQIILCHPLFLLPSNLSQHQGLFKSVSSLHQVARILEFQLQHQSFWWIFRADLLYDWLLRFPWSPRHSQESSPTTQFKSINSLALGFLYSPTLTSVHD